MMYDAVAWVFMALVIATWLVVRLLPWFRLPTEERPPLADHLLPQLRVERAGCSRCWCCPWR